MSDHIVKVWNKTMKEDDVLYCLGDWCFGGVENIWNFRKQLRVKEIHFIFGNHDEKIIENKVLPNCFYEIDSNGNHYLTSDKTNRSVYAKDIFESTQSVLNISHGKHNFFLSHYFRDHFEEWLDNPAAITAPINITRIEVWVTNTNTATEDTRNIIGFQDLGEENPIHIYNPNKVVPELGFPYPSNEANNLYYNLTDPSQSTAADIRSFINSTQPLTQDFNFTGKRDN